MFLSELRSALICQTPTIRATALGAPVPSVSRAFGGALPPDYHYRDDALRCPDPHRHQSARRHRRRTANGHGGLPAGAKRHHHADFRHPDDQQAPHHPWPRRLHDYGQRQ